MKNKIRGFSRILVVVLVFVGILVAGGLFYAIPKMQKQTGPKSDKVYKVGVLSGLNLFAGIVDSFQAELKDMGYVEGKNIVYDVQKTNFEPDKEKQILDKFVDDKVDLIFGFNTEVAMAAKQATQGTQIPVIFANALVEGNNLIDSVQAPGGNITGVQYPNKDIAVKRLEVLHEVVPQAKRIWLPFQQGYPTVGPELEAIRPEAKKLGVEVIEFPSKDLTTLEAELVRRSKLDDMGFDAVLLIPESLSTTKAAFEIIARYTKNQKIPIGGSSVGTESYGTVFAVTINNEEIGKLAAGLADKVLGGKKAGTIPIVSPEQYLILYYKNAQQLGISFNEGLMSRANEIIR